MSVEHVYRQVETLGRCLIVSNGPRFAVLDEYMREQAEVGTLEEARATAAFLGHGEAL